MGSHHIVLNQLQAAAKQAVQLDSPRGLSLRHPKKCDELLHFHLDDMRRRLFLREDHRPIAANAVRFNHLWAQREVFSVIWYHF